MKWKLRDLDRIKARLAVDLSYMALQYIVQNECVVSQGERLTGTSNLANFKGKRILLWPRQHTHRSKSLTMGARDITEKKKSREECKRVISLIDKILQELTWKYNKKTNLGSRTSLISWRWRRCGYRRSLRDPKCCCSCRSRGLIVRINLALGSL